MGAVRSRGGFVMGDIGEPIRHIELEPVEVPYEVPQPAPDREGVPA